MTALALPAPDAPASEWGRLAVSLPGWRWMPGMRYTYGGFCASTGASEHYVERLCEDNAGPYEHAISPTPDPDDPSGATAGCLRALLGKRLHIEHGTYLARVVVLQEPAVNGLYPQGEQRNIGRACIAAAAALGRWPGGHSDWAHEDVAQRAVRLLGTDHPDAGSTTGDLAEALRQLSALRCALKCWPGGGA